MFKLFAELIAFHLDARESLRASDARMRSGWHLYGTRHLYGAAP